MKRSLPLVSLVVLFAASTRADAPAPPSTEEGQVVSLETVKWKAAAKPVEAVQVSPIAVDPVTKGSIGYAKFPAGFKFPAHWHSATEYSVVISGKAVFTIDGKDHVVTPGTYVVIPPKTRHSLTCDAGAQCVLLTRRAGPTDYNWVDAK